MVIKFEEITTLAGDFYGLPKQPTIAPFKGEEDSACHQRFTDAYNTLVRAPKEELQKELEQAVGHVEERMRRR